MSSRLRTPCRPETQIMTANRYASTSNRQLRPIDQQAHTECFGRVRSTSGDRVCPSVLTANRRPLGQQAPLALALSAERGPYPEAQLALVKDESGKRCRRLSNSQGIAGVAELSPSMSSPARSRRLLRPGASTVRRGYSVATRGAGQPHRATRRGRPPRPPSPHRSPVDERPGLETRRG